MRLIHSNDAVSDTLGFVLMIAVVILAAGVLYATGFPLIHSKEEATHMQEMEQSFKVLGRNINKVAFGEAPRRSSEIKIYKGAMSTTRESYMRINHTIYTLGTIEYTTERETIAYEGTGVFARYSTGGMIILHEPHINIAGTPAIPVIILNGTGSVGGVGVVRVIVEEADEQEPAVLTRSESTSLEIRSEYYEAWARFFNESLNITATVNVTAKTVNVTLPGDVIVAPRRLNVWVVG
jgi:FlaG/FlaF family flagellin (archaellin)